MKKNKTVWLVVGAVALAIFAGAAGYCAESAPATTAAVPTWEEWDPGTYKGETGTIVLPFEFTAGSLSLRRLENGKPTTKIMLDGKGTEMKVPVGTYLVGTYMLEIKAKNDTKWSLRGGSPDVATGTPIEIKSGESTKLNIGDKFAAAISSGKTGTMSSPFATTTSLTMGMCTSKADNSEVLMVSCKGSSAAVPATEGYIGYTSIDFKDESGKKWSMDATATSFDKVKATKFKADADTKLKVAEPLTASVTTQQTGDKWKMDFALAGADGAKYLIWPADIKADAPRFEVVDKSGKVLQSGKFAYG